MLARSFWLVLLLLLLVSFATHNAIALSPEYQIALENQLRIIIDKNPRYFWSGAEDESRGLDCSGYLFLAAKRSGIPVTRTTSFRMSQGLGGWFSVPVSLKDMTHLDLTFFTWKRSPQRPNGHVGVILLNPGDTNPRVTHASESRGVILEPLKGVLIRDLTSIRHLTIGDSE